MTVNVKNEMVVTKLTNLSVAFKVDNERISILLQQSELSKEAFA